MLQDKVHSINIKMKGQVGIAISDNGVNYREVAKGKNFVGTLFDKYMRGPKLQ
jgi:hypothetical protein